MNKDNAKDYLHLVQALVEGKTVQYRLLGGKWSTGGDFDFSLPPDQYRIKPEPREIWVNEYPSGTSVVHKSKAAADASVEPQGGGVTCHYREVIE